MSKARDLADSVSTGGVLADGTVTVSEISDLTVTAAELNNVAGVNSDVQTQLDLKAPLASPTFTGDVGIGTTPTGSWNLQLATATGSSRIRMQNSTTGTTDSDGGSVAMEGNDFVLQNSESGVVKVEMGGSERMRIDSSGNVGIGAASSGDRLEVKGINDIAKFYSDSTASQLRLQAPTVNVIGLYTGTSDALTFGTNSTERMRIDSSGNVGIGTTSPAAKLQVDGDLYVGDHTRLLEDDDLKFVAPASTTGVQNARIAWWNENEAGIMAMIAVDRTASLNAPGDLVFYTTDNVDTLANSSEGDRSEKLRITSDGAFGVNGTNYGTSGQVLTSGGSGAAPTWTTISAGAPFSGFGS